MILLSGTETACHNNNSITLNYLNPGSLKKTYKTGHQPSVFDTVAKILEQNICYPVYYPHFCYPLCY